MKLCPHCKTELADYTRFCLNCMTALDEKEQIPPPTRPIRRWPFLLCGFLLAAVLLAVALYPKPQQPKQADAPVLTVETTEPVQKAEQTQLVDGVRYIYRPATSADHPSAIVLDGYYVLVGVEGTAPNGVYQVPSFVGDDMTALVTVIADGAFDGIDAKVIDLGYNVRYVWGDAFGGCSLTDLYLHSDVLIDRAAFSGCTGELTIHGPEYLTDTEDGLWMDIAGNYGFRWQTEPI